MATGDSRQQKELLELGEVTSRVASYLRQAKSGFYPDDKIPLEKAIHFLGRAKEGGAFLSRRVGQLHSDTLESLSWATDALLCNSAWRPRETDYERVVEKLSALEAILRGAMENPEAVEAVQYEQSLLFFEALSDIVGSRIDSQLRDSSSNRARLSLM